MTIAESRRPVLGLSTYLQQTSSGVWNVPASFLPAFYINAVTMVGGIATLLPPQPVDAAVTDRVLDGLDGLIVTGGRDVDPTMYGATPHPTTDIPARDRDAWEFSLVRGAMARGLPLLGICRGAQVLNTVLGGTLHQHLPDLLRHNRHQAGSAVFTTTAISTVPGTKVATLIGASSEAQCYHHQAIAEVGDGLMVSARDAEGVIEAVEVDPRRYPHHWAVAVQWHPEERLEDLRLFAGLADAACAYRSVHLMR